jgi:hypothetical protein
MKKPPKTSKHSNKDQENHIIEVSKNVALLRDLPFEKRIKEANKPIYLTRYE